MDAIEALIPAPRQADLAGLERVDADDLARYVLDPDHPWWRRRECARALAGRVPAQRLPDLSARIRDPAETTEVRIALLDAVGDQPELLPWLRHGVPRTSASYGMVEAVLKARGVLGDRTALEDLIALADDEWPHRRVSGAAGLDALVARYGPAAVLADLDGSRAADRAFRIRMRHRGGEDVTDALADPDVGVAHLAHTHAGNAERLRAYLDRAPTTDAALWAA
jgi:hypothetical protein